MLAPIRVNIPSVHICVAQVHVFLASPLTIHIMSTRAATDNAGLQFTKRRCPEAQWCHTGCHQIDRTDSVYMVWCNMCKNKSCCKRMDPSWVCYDCRQWELAAQLEKTHISEQPAPQDKKFDWAKCFSNDLEMVEKPSERIGLPPAIPEPHLCMEIAED